MNNQSRIAILPGIVAVLNVAILITVPIAPAEPPSSASIAQVPLREGLTLVTASQQDRGDFEIIKTVTKVDAKAITVTVVSDEPTFCGEEVFGRDGTRPSISRRAVLREDMERARTVQFWFPSCLSEPQFNPGITAISVSAIVLRELKAEGRASLNIIGDDHITYAGVFTRIERHAVPFKVIFNDEPVELAAVHVRATSSQVDKKRWSEYWLLDDVTNPLVLRKVSSSGQVGLDIVKLSFPSGERAARLERNLSEQGRTVVYGIYFDFASDRIKEESEPVLKEIADVLAKNPTWRLAVEGHTDNLGGTEANLRLSQRRAASVRKVLGERYTISPTRLEPSGFGETKPKATNDTLEGRALNRRVELVRIGR